MTIFVCLGFLYNLLFSSVPIFTINGIISPISAAAIVLTIDPRAIQLRFLQTLTEVATEKNSTLVFPVLIDLFDPFVKKIAEISKNVYRLIFLGVFFMSCTKQVPDIIYLNCDIWTGGVESTRIQAIAIQDETILALGNNREIEALKGDNTRLIDLEGHFVVPGFIDSHTHIMSGGFQLTGIDLRGANEPREFIRRIKAFAQDLSPGKWILEGEWDHEKWGGELPHRSWIDSVTKDIPVFVSRLDGHMALANSKALELAGISSGTPDPPGGLINREKKSGEPTGILKDEAMLLVSNVIPEPSKEELDETFQRAENFVLSKGITQVHDMCSWRDFETYLRAKERGNLKIRIYAFLWYEECDRLIQYIKEHGTGDDWLRWNGMKAMADGSLGSSTAWMYDPYLDDPSTKGLVTNPDTTELKETLLQADKAGIQLAVHAIGDHANDWVLGNYKIIKEKNGSRDRRLRIEHAQHLRKESINRFAKQGVIASVQPYHVVDDGVWAGKRIHPDVLRTSYAFRSLLDAHAIISFGSDWSVAPISPIKGIYAAVTRRTGDGKNPNGWYPEQKITITEALQAYTIGCAYAGFQEDILGTLEEGKLADFVVLSENLFNTNPRNFPEINVLRTVVGGQDQFLAD